MSPASGSAARSPVRPGQESLLPDPAEVDHAVVFAGHMVDLPDRDEPRFPPELEPRVRDAVEAALRELAGSPGGAAVGLSAAARGGDLLFVEACARLDLPHLLCLPFEPERFVETSVEGAGDEWVRRFRAAVEAAAPGPLIMPSDYPGPGPDSGPYRRFNVWLLELARQLADDVSLLAVWDGRGGDGPGGTEDMVRTVREGGGDVIQVNPAVLMRELRQEAGR